MSMIRLSAARLRHLATGFVPLALLALAAAGPGCSVDAGAIGPAGANGKDAVDGTRGEDGTNGTDGTDGTDGKDGVSPVVDQSLSPIEKAFVAIGGKAAISSLKTFTIDTSGARWVSGEGYAPEEPATQVSTFKALINADLAANDLRLDYVRDIAFIGFNTKTTFSEILKDKLGYISGVEHLFGAPGGDMISDRWASTRKQQRLLNPHIILRDAAADPSIVSEAGFAVLDGSLHHLVNINDKTRPVTLFVNVQTGTIDKAVTVESHHLDRDVDLEVFYHGWKPAGGGLLFPSDVYLALDGQIVNQESRSSVKVNEAIDAKLFDFPTGATPVFDQAAADRGDANHQFHQGFASFGIPLDGEQTFVQASVLAPNVHYLLGGSHNSLAVVQANGIVLLEAPLYEARSNAIINWAQTNFPSKPITHVIATHFHTDHAAGLRTFVAAGAKIVVGESSAVFFRELFKASSTVVPDSLSKTPKAAVLITVPAGGSYTIADATTPVAAYDVQNPHAEGMLMGYLPGAKIAFNSDLFNSGTPAFVPPPFLAGAKALHDSITVTHQLPVTFMAGGHGGAPNTFAEFKAAIGL
jgi:glyoxylase-like metal-dependent hydrolase (beta-lactamase superfamily II)